MSWTPVVKEAKVLYAPVGKKNGEDGAEEIKFIPMGIKITLDNGEWWFRHRKTGSWTRHTPGQLKKYKSGSPMIGPDGVQEREPETKTRWESDQKLAAAFVHCRVLVDTLADAVIAALEEDAAKKAA